MTNPIPNIMLSARSILVLFIPGAFLILASRMYKEFSLLEIFVLAFGSSIAIIDFLVILLGRTPFHITRASILSGIVIFSGACYFILFFTLIARKTKKKMPSCCKFQSKRCQSAQPF